MTAVIVLGNGPWLAVLAAGMVWCVRRGKQAQR